ncbi:MAG: hypothetical protein ACI4DU_11080 [Lachnospiraceae bacterium]
MLSRCAMASSLVQVVRAFSGRSFREEGNDSVKLLNDSGSRSVTGKSRENLRENPVENNVSISRGFVVIWESRRDLIYRDE